MRQKINVLFVIILAISLFYPGISTLIRLSQGKIKKKSDAERRLLTIPLNIKNAQSLREKFQQTEKLLEDQFFLRGDVQIIYNRIMVFGFKHTNVGYVILGHDGYWFTVGTKHKFFSRFEIRGQSLPKFKIHRIARRYQKFSRHMAKKNIITTTIFIPTKPYIFSEKLPDCFKKMIPKLENKSVTRLAQAMRCKESLVFYPFQLTKKMAEDEIYFRRGFHWHEQGAQNILFQQFNMENPFKSLRVSPVPLKNLQIQPSRISFDLARILGLGELQHETRTYTLPYTTELVKNKEVYIAKRKFMKSQSHLNFIESSNKNGIKTFLITFSFGFSAIRYIAQHFQTTIHANANGLHIQPGIIREMAEEFSPNVIIFLFNESHVSHPERLMKLFSIKKYRTK